MRGVFLFLEQIPFYCDSMKIRKFCLYIPSITISVDRLLVLLSFDRNKKDKTNCISERLSKALQLRKEIECLFFSIQEIIGFFDLTPKLRSIRVVVTNYLIIHRLYIIQKAYNLNVQLRYISNSLAFVWVHLSFKLSHIVFGSFISSSSFLLFGSLSIGII